MKKNPTVKSANSSQLIFIALGIAVFTYICFSPALKNGFINWDDNGYVFENANLNKPFSKAIGYFFGPHYFIGNYIPATMLVYTLEYHVAGLKPHFFHTVNVLIHLLNVALMFWFIYALSDKRLLVAGLVALFFGIHPMHVESVAWVSELKDVLYTAFFLAGLIAYLIYKKHNYQSIKFLLYALGFFLLSLLSKPAAVIFPLVLLLLDYYTGRSFNRRAWLEKLPFFIVSVIFGIITICAQQADHLVHQDYSFFQKICFASHSLLIYLIKCILPFGLSIFYPYPGLTNGQLPWFYYVSPIVMLALLYGLFRALKHSKLVGFGALFFLVNVILVLQFISVGDAIMAERYTYLSYTGIFFVLAMGADSLYYRATAAHQKYKPVVTAVLVIAAISCAYATYSRCKVWQNDDSIATDLVNKYPNDRLALNNKGFILMEQKRYAEALPLLTHAVALKPDYKMAYVNLISTYLNLNDYNNALKIADTALSYVHNDVDLLNRKGRMLFELGNYNAALSVYRQALQAQSDYVPVYMNLSECYFKMQNYPEALNALDKALAVEPENYILLNDKGYVLMAAGKFAEAQQSLEASLKLKPDYGTAQANLSACQRAMTAAAK